MSDLIKNIFLPERIGAYYLFSKRIVGVDISKASITLTKTRVRKENSVIEMVLEEKLDGETEESDGEKISRALKNLFSKIGKYDEIRTSLPSSVVVFKELTLPFITRDQITMVVGFEIEPLLPFALQDAVIDFVITRENLQEKSSEIMVTAVQKQYIIEHIALFQAADLDPDIITVDMFALYNLYKHIPSYANLQGATALIDIGLDTTHIALMINSQLKMVRTLSKGILFLAKKIAQEVSISPQEAMENLLRFGLEKTDMPNYTQATHNATNLLWNDMSFTLVSFSALFFDRKPMTKIIFLGDGTRIQGFIETLIQKSGVPAEVFNINNVDENKTITIKNNIPISPVQLISVGSSLPSPLFDDYTLRQKEFSPPHYSLLIKQLVVFLVLILGIFVTLFVHRSIELKKLNKEILSSKTEALAALKEKFPDLKDEKNLSTAIEAAKDEVKKEQETWFAFSSQSRGAFLQYLLELKTRIDAKRLGFVIEQITIAQGTLILKAQVKGIDELQILERELSQSHLLKNYEPQEKPQFTMKITLTPSTEEF